MAGTVSTGGLAALAAKVSRKKNRTAKTNRTEEKQLTRERDAIAAERRDHTDGALTGR